MLRAQNLLQYISLEDMDNYISGNHEESTQAFNIGVALLEKILLRAIEDQPAKVRTAWSHCLPAISAQHL